MIRAEWDDRLCRERSENIRQRIVADEEKMMRLEKNTAKLSELSVQMGEIIKYHREQLDRQEQRLTEIEKRPVKLTEIVRSAFISAAVSGLTAYVISTIFK